MSAASVPRLSVEDFLAAERAGDLKGEYHDGEVFYPMASATWNHGVVSGNSYQALVPRLKGTSCRASVAAVKVRIGPTKFVVPDLVVVCGNPAFVDGSADVITNPKLVIEVLSPSTGDYDQGGKFGLYRLLPSFEEYVLIAQDQPLVEVRTKTAVDHWKMTFYEGLDALAKLESLDIVLPLTELHDGVLDS